MKSKNVLAGLVGAGVILSAGPAFAGQWKINPRLCPDIVEDRIDRLEDRRDERVTYGRRDRVEDRLDRRENRRDERVTICPVKAFYYEPGRLRARPPLKWDRGVHMHYRYYNGRKIYVRL